MSPFDSLVFERRRLLDLFGIHYRIGLYTPVEQRVHGYYVYLFVMDDRIASRVDLKADRATSTLQVQAAWLEPDAPEAETAARLAAELRRMADWLGLVDVHVKPVGTLSTALALACGQVSTAVEFASTPQSLLRTRKIGTRGSSA